MSYPHSRVWVRQLVVVASRACGSTPFNAAASPHRRRNLLVRTPLHFHERIVEVAAAAHVAQAVGGQCIRGCAAGAERSPPAGGQCDWAEGKFAPVPGETEFIPLPPA